MAPPLNRRSKQGSSPSPSPNPLPGIAIGIFAAVAAGFAARRALRRKGSLQSKNDEEHAGIPPLLHEKEIEITGKDAPHCPAGGTIEGACKYAKLVADLEFLVDAKKDGLLLQKGSADKDEGQENKEEAEALDGQVSQKNVNAEGGMKKAYTVEGGESSDKDGEISEIPVKVKATLTFDGPCLKVLQTAVLLTSEEKGGEEEGKAISISTAEDEDTGEDGDDDRSSAGQLPSPVLINGKFLEFFVDEMSDLRDEQDLSTSGSNSLSDSMSESSMQEMSSAPVKPLVLADEAMETSLEATKPNIVGASDRVGKEEIHVAEKKSWSDVEKDSKDRELPAMEETVYPPVDKEGVDSNEGITDSNDELDGDGKAIPAENGCNDLSDCGINEVNVEILSDNCVALEGQFSVKLSGEGKESARINGKVLSDARSLGECNNLVLPAVNESPNEDLSIYTLQKEAVSEPACINGKVLSDNSSNYPCLIVGFTPNDGSSLQSAQEVACHGVLETDCEKKLQSTMGVPLDILHATADIPHATVEVEHLGPSVEDMPGIGNDDESNPQASKGDDVYVGNVDLVDMLGMEIVGLMDSKETMGISTSNLVVHAQVEPVQEWTKKMTDLVSIKEPAMQSAGHDVCMMDSIKEDVPVATQDVDGSKDDLEVSIDNQVEDIGESTQKITSLEIGPLEESFLAEEPAMQAGGDDDTISEVIGNEIQNATHDAAGLGSADETNLEGIEGLSTDNPAINSEVLPTGELTQKLPGLKSGPLEQPIMHSRGIDIVISAVIANDNVENNVDTEKEQPSSLLTSLEDSTEEDHELCPRAAAEEVENAPAAGSKEDKLPEFGVAHSRTDTKQQEIEELISNDDLTDDLQEIVRWTSSQHTSGSNKRESDEVLTMGAVGLQSGSSFSCKVWRYLPVEVALICLLIALVSFLLQYLEGLLSVQHKTSSPSE